jgi:hypothetical protein
MATQACFPPLASALGRRHNRKKIHLSTAVVVRMAPGRLATMDLTVQVGTAIGSRSLAY